MVSCGLGEIDNVTEEGRRTAAILIFRCKCDLIFYPSLLLSLPHIAGRLVVELV